MVIRFVNLIGPGIAFGGKLVGFLQKLFAESGYISQLCLYGIHLLLILRRNSQQILQSLV